MSEGCLGACDGASRAGVLGGNKYEYGRNYCGVDRHALRKVRGDSAPARGKCNDPVGVWGAELLQGAEAGGA